MTTAFATTARRLALSTVGAILLSAGVVAAPAFAAEPAAPNAPLTIADWQEKVGAQLDENLRMRKGALRNRDHIVGKVVLSFASDGSYAGARVVHSSGSRMIDREMVRVADVIAYPPLPAGLRGRPQTVALQAYFGEASSQEAAVRHEAAVEALARGDKAKHDAVQTAALPSG